MSSTTQVPELKRVLGMRDVMLFMVTASASPQWAATSSPRSPKPCVCAAAGATPATLAHSNRRVRERTIGCPSCGRRFRVVGR